MSRLPYFRAKNAMLMANFFSNAMGVAVVVFISRGMGKIFSPEIAPLGSTINRIFIPIAFIIQIIIALIYEKPIRNCLNGLRDQVALSPIAILDARRKVLNEPFFLIGMNSVVWLAAAVIYSGMFWAHGAGREMIEVVLFQTIFTGLITVTIAFFVLEFVLQRRIVHFLFPEGGLSLTPGTQRIRIRTRLIALLFAVNIVPLVAVSGDILHIIHAGENAYQTLKQLRSIIFFQIFIFIWVGAWMIFLVSSNLTKPFEEIIKVLRQIKNGNFAGRVRVTSNDEIGYTGDVINEMTQGLIERDKIRHSLNLAREVQQNLLPKQNFSISGIDMAGKSVYCDETGGDYYDFILIGNGLEKKFGIVIGDVSGHGISSALLMATVRSSLRQRTALPGSAAEIITDVNRQLVKDVEDSGQFVTLFFMILDPESKTLDWVRAGHDPAMIYDPGSDIFDPLGGRGLALGVDADWIYDDNEKKDISNGQIIFLSTDGIWEARNKKGEMLGKGPILNAIRRNANLSAPQIIDAIFDRLDKFTGELKLEDDITSVVIKMQN